MIKTLLLAAMLTIATAAVAQDAPRGPRRQGPPPTVQCEEMKKLMKAVQDHRASCEVCKTNLPPRGPLGPGPRGEGQGQRRGPGGPPQR